MFVVYYEFFDRAKRMDTGTVSCKQTSLEFGAALWPNRLNRIQIHCTCFQR